MTDVLIKRDLLERAAFMELDTSKRSIAIQDELRAILAAAPQRMERIQEHMRQAPPITAHGDKLLRNEIRQGH